MVKLLNIQADTAVLIYQFVVQMIRFFGGFSKSIYRFLIR